MEKAYKQVSSFQDLDLRPVFKTASIVQIRSCIYFAVAFSLHVGHTQFST